MSSPDILHEPDESRPVKRARLEAPLSATEDLQDEMDDEDGWDDIYGTATDTAPLVNDANIQDSSMFGETITAQETEQPMVVESSTTELAMPSSMIVAPESAKTSDVTQPSHQREAATIRTQDGVPPEAIDTGDQLVAENAQLPSTDASSAAVLAETTTIEVVPVAADQALKGDDSKLDGHNVHTPTEVNGTSAAVKPSEDAEFLAAAAAQKGEKGAEWQFDSSDAESLDSASDSSSDSSDDSSSDSDGGYELLDPATAAKILMSGDGEDEDGERGNKAGGDNQPRTTNEIKEDIVPKPDVIVTPEMKITLLGIVDQSVENMVLIKASTPGEYQVLEAGSVLCNEAREVIGAVAETFGRVQEPIYSVAFTNERELAETGLVIGSKVFYVDIHSTFVFTQPLRNTKGTDASNIHDEEVGENEVEFSDDEKEAEYKRMKKLAKRGGRGGLSRSAFNAERDSSAMDYGERDQNFVTGGDAPQQQYGGGMSYDDDAQDEFYSPLKRPDNLSQMMASGGPPRASPAFERGRGRGRGDFRGRGRGDRGRGRGGFDNRSPRGSGAGGGGGRSDHGNSPNAPQTKSHRGNSQSFPDRHNHEAAAEREQYSNQARASSLSSSAFANISTASASNSYPAHAYATHGQPSYPDNRPMQGAPVPSTANYPPNLIQHQANAPQVPPSAYVNPSYFPAWPQQQAQWQPNPWNTQPQGQPGQWPAQYQQNQSTSPQQNNLADILRQLGGRPQ